jgi:Tol biopolymer transport system component
MIAFVSNRSGEKKVWIMASNGDKQRQIFTGKGECDTPAWSPRLTH